MFQAFCDFDAVSRLKTLGMLRCMTILLIQQKQNWWKRSLLLVVHAAPTLSCARFPLNIHDRHKKPLSPPPFLPATTVALVSEALAPWAGSGLLGSRGFCFDFPLKSCLPHLLRYAGSTRIPLEVVREKTVHCRATGCDI